MKPGSGANKKLAKVGDVSVMGIIAEQSVFNYSLFSATRLNVIYRMSEIIAEGIFSYILDLIQNAGVKQAYADVFTSFL